MKKILILEDEDVLANIYKKNLESAGFKVLCKKTVDEALKTLKKFKPDLAFIDHGIYGEEKAGIDLIPELKKMYPESKIVMLSNYSHFQLKEDSLNAGADDFLVKLNMPPRALVEYVKKLFS